jgi:hypothetical protein
LVDANVLLDVMSAEAIERAADRHFSSSIPSFMPKFRFGIRSSRNSTRHSRRPCLAGKSFLAYRRRGGSRRSPLPDFFIGARAAIAGYLLMTRDAARYRNYYPKPSLIGPN